MGDFLIIWEINTFELMGNPWISIDSKDSTFSTLSVDSTFTFPAELWNLKRSRSTWVPPTGPLSSNCLWPCPPGQSLWPHIWTSTTVSFPYSGPCGLSNCAEGQRPETQSRPLWTSIWLSPCPFREAGGNATLCPCYFYFCILPSPFFAPLSPRLRK